MTESNQQKKHTRLVVKLALIVIGMFGFGFALVPLYDVFCDITGVNAKIEAEAAPTQGYVIDPNREITLEFVTSVNGNTPLRFAAETAKMKVIPGKSYRANFSAENLADHGMIGQAVPSITPGLATEYLKKTECFCFSQQEFKAGEKKIMPVQFVIDPELPEKYKSVTLSYTFFDVTADKYRNN
jgi:cytochrome c oxidase assembly protein subunit 11